MPRPRALAALTATVALMLGAATAASAHQPDRWLLTGASSVPSSYWQGLTSDPAGANLYFVGVFEGLWRTTPLLRRTAGVPNAIPAAVEASEGYNHIGDPSWNPGGGGRVLLPMECFVPGAGNTCGTGAFGVADPETLGFRYYVKLDPAEIAKAMWAETSPDGSLIWTSSGNDLLAYRSSEVSAANGAPTGPLLRPVRRIEHAVPPSGVTGATFWERRLLLAGEDDGTHQVWSVNPHSGKRRLALQMRICGESEGLDVVATLGGELHWLIAPFDPGCALTFGPSSALLHFAPSHGRARLGIELVDTAISALPGTARATVRVTRHGRPVRGARVGFAGGLAMTGKRGLATVSAPLRLPGRFKVLARRGGTYGLSGFVAVGSPAVVLGARPAHSGAG